MTKHRNKPSKAPEASAAPDGAAAVTLQKPAQAPTPPKFKPRREAEVVKAPNALQRLIIFFKEARRELTRVTWPKRDETINSTGVLLVLVAISAVYLALVDGILTRILKLIVG
jgi:preprotein translocase subunit SecE